MCECDTVRSSLNIFDKAATQGLQMQFSYCFEAIKYRYICVINSKIKINTI